MSQITSHILDIAKGSPAKGVPISLHRQTASGWDEVGAGLTNDDGRVQGLCHEGEVMPAGTYRMHFNTTAYFEANGQEVFYPVADIVFNIKDGGEHYHIPLLLSPFGYSTYRGS